MCVYMCAYVQALAYVCVNNWEIVVLFWLQGIRNVEAVLKAGMAVRGLGGGRKRLSYVFLI